MKRYGLQIVDNLRKPRLIPQTLCQWTLKENKLNNKCYLFSGVNLIWNEIESKKWVWQVT